MYSPFRISRLVTLLSASRGDRWKNLGVRLGGKVRGLRHSALSRPRVFHGAPGLGLWARWSKCSTEAGRGWRWRGYQPLPGPPASLSSSAPTIAWPADNSASLCKTSCQLKGLALLMRDYLGTNTNTILPKHSVMVGFTVQEAWLAHEHWLISSTTHCYLVPVILQEDWKHKYCLHKS